MLSLERYFAPANGHALLRFAVGRCRRHRAVNVRPYIIKRPAAAGIINRAELHRAHCRSSVVKPETFRRGWRDISFLEDTMKLQAALGVAEERNIISLMSMPWLHEAYVCWPVLRFQSGATYRMSCRSRARNAANINVAQLPVSVTSAVAIGSQGETRR